MAKNTANPNATYKKYKDASCNKIIMLKALEVGAQGYACKTRRANVVAWIGA